MCDGAGSQWGNLTSKIYGNCIQVFKSSAKFEKLIQFMTFEVYNSVRNDS